MAVSAVEEGGGVAAGRMNGWGVGEEGSSRRRGGAWRKCKYIFATDEEDEHSEAEPQPKTRDATTEARRHGGALERGGFTAMLRSHEEGVFNRR